MEVHVHIQFLSALFCVKQETKKNLLSDVGERGEGPSRISIEACK